MKTSKKIISLLLILSMILIPLRSYAILTLVCEVKNQATPVNFDEGVLTKKITNIQNDEVTIELNLSINNNKVIKSDTEILFLIDNSSSMKTVLEDGLTSRKTKILNSTKELIRKINKNNPNVKMGLISFEGKTQLIQDFTNDEDTLQNACNTLIEKNCSGGTNMASALNIAKQKFNESTKNKILVLLTDGLPTDGQKQTKAQLQDENVYIISTLVDVIGLDDKNKKNIENIFGTQQAPTADRFYNIEDRDIETIISKNIYERILEDFQSVVTNIKIDDYFPDEILKNFDITINEISKGETIKEKDFISWSINNLKASQNAILKYTLKLKDEYDSNIIEKILNTNKNVKLNYTNMIGDTKNLEMIDSPQIKITINKEEQINDTKNTQNTYLDNNQITKKADKTITNLQMPYTGTNSFILILLVIVLSGVSFIIIKRKLDN